MGPTRWASCRQGGTCAREGAGTPQCGTSLLYLRLFVATGGLIVLFVLRVDHHRLSSVWVDVRPTYLLSKRN
jgi:hypothetical protein